MITPINERVPDALTPHITEFSFPSGAHIRRQKSSWHDLEGWCIELGTSRYLYADGVERSLPRHQVFADLGFPGGEDDLKTDDDWAAVAARQEELSKLFIMTLEQAAKLVEDHPAGNRRVVRGETVISVYGDKEILVTDGGEDSREEGEYFWGKSAEDEEPRAYRLMNVRLQSKEVPLLPGALVLADKPMPVFDGPSTETEDAFDTIANYVYPHVRKLAPAMASHVWWAAKRLADDGRWPGLLIRDIGQHLLDSGDGAFSKEGELAVRATVGDDGLLFVAVQTSWVSFTIKFLENNMVELQESDEDEPDTCSLYEIDVDYYDVSALMLELIMPKEPKPDAVAIMDLLSKEDSYTLLAKLEMGAESCRSVDEEIVELFADLMKPLIETNVPGVASLVTLFWLTMNSWSSEVAYESNGGTVTTFSGYTQDLFEGNEIILKSTDPEDGDSSWSFVGGAWTVNGEPASDNAIASLDYSLHKHADWKEVGRDRSVSKWYEKSE